MTLLRDFLLLLIPVIVVVVGAWLVMRYYVKSEKDKLVVKIGLKNKTLITPVRLQAYERIVLLLERMEPTQIIIRNISLGQTASQLHQSLISNIREEFDHNLSQQLYISSQAWNLIKQARETTIAAINDTASKVSPDAPASDLAQLLFEDEIQTEISGLNNALEFVKEEARLLF